MKRREDKIINLGQEKYIEGIFKRLDMEECKQINTPININSRLCWIDEPLIIKEVEKMEKVPYKEVIGCFKYVMIAIRLDITTIFGVFNKFTNHQNSFIGKQWNESLSIQRA